jgi:hypothetical protein
MAKAYITPREWYLCMDAGIEIIKRPHETRRFPARGVPVITFYHITSFEDCTGWTVYSQGTHKGCFVQKVCWRQSLDGERMREFMEGNVASVSPSPTLDEATSALDASWLEQQLAALNSLRFPLYARGPQGCDGESFGVLAPHVFAVEWWCEGPREWAELIRWTQDCIGYFERLAWTVPRADGIDISTLLPEADVEQILAVVRARTNEEIISIRDAENGPQVKTGRLSGHLWKVRRAPSGWKILQSLPWAS